jgi:hypothetical protein
MIPVCLAYGIIHIVQAHVPDRQIKIILPVKLIEHIGIDIAVYVGRSDKEVVNVFLLRIEAVPCDPAEIVRLYKQIIQSLAHPHENSEGQYKCQKFFKIENK